MIREREIEHKLKKMIENNGGLCLKWVSPGCSGVPDRICLLPKTRIVFVETKKPKGGEISPLQRYWGQKLRKLGFYVAYVFDDNDVATLEILLQAGLS